MSMASSRASHPARAAARARRACTCSSSRDAEPACQRACRSQSISAAASARRSEREGRRHRRPHRGAGAAPPGGRRPRRRPRQSLGSQGNHAPEGVVLPDTGARLTRRASVQRHGAARPGSLRGHPVTGDRGAKRRPRTPPPAPARDCARSPCLAVVHAISWDLLPVLQDISRRVTVVIDVQGHRQQ